MCSCFSHLCYSKSLMKDFVRFSCTEVRVFPLTKTVLEFSDLLCAVSEAMS